MSEEKREHMVRTQIESRGVSDPLVLAAMKRVAREAFVPPEMEALAYEDTPLPIGEGQTISQPYIVAVMAEALELDRDDRVLEVGAGSGYAAAVLGAIAKEVWTIERMESLAKQAKRRIEEIGYGHVHVVHGDGTRGLPEHAPFDAILVSAGGPSVPQVLLDQLAEGGRLVIPVGDTPRAQELIRIVKAGPGDYRREHLGAVRFVPLVGEHGWANGASDTRPTVVRPREGVVSLIRESAEPIGGIDGADLSALLARIGDARVVLLGEATHGTSEFYRMRARITQELVTRHGFNCVAVEADWPDAARIDHYIRHLPSPPAEHRAFTRFPQWMWRNRETLELVEWLRAHNEVVTAPERSVSFHGLDLYSLYTSIDRVIAYLEKEDPETARLARERYGCLSPWQGEAALYGRTVVTERFAGCEKQVTAMLRDLLAQRLEGEAFFDAVRNAKVIAGAEQYYRIMYYGSRASWNLRDTHMFETLQAILEHRGPGSRAVIWAHNSHVGDARATEMGARGEINIGSLCRRHFGDEAYIVGFGTDHGTVAAAHDWDDPMSVMQVRPSHPKSYERLFHEAGIPALLLHLRRPRRDAVRDELMTPRLERAIGVVYRPETELASHYFHAVLPVQLDEYVWFDETHAVTPLATTETHGDLPETYPFGL